MPITPEDLDDADAVRLTVPIDGATLAWLADISHACHVAPELVVASMLRDLRQDDEAEHAGDIVRRALADRGPASSTLN